MSNENDPFSAFGADRTVIKPAAGRAGKAAADPTTSVTPGGAPQQANPL